MNSGQRPQSRPAAPGGAILACDLGGTNISALACDLDARPLGSVHTLPTLAELPREKSLANLRAVMSSALSDVPADRQIAAVGFAAKGPLDWRTCTLKAESLPNLFNLDLGGFVQAEFGARTFLENNANCQALAEASSGAAVGHAVVVGVNLGTGFGCGIVINGEIFRGATGNAGEFEWCLHEGEKYDEVLSGRGPLRFHEKVAESADAISIQEMVRSAEGGDVRALAAFDAYGAAVGSALGHFAATVDPSIIVLGGSGTAQLELFSASLERELRRRVAPDVANSLRVVRSALGRHAGLIGAASHALNGLRERA